MLPSEFSDISGKTIVVRGRNFFNHNDLSCNFGAQGATRARFVSAQEIHCQAPVVQIPPSQNVVHAPFWISGGSEATASKPVKFYVTMFVSDQANHAVHMLEGHHGRVLQESFVKPGAGGLSMPTGVALGKDKNLYVLSHGTNQILRYDAKTGGFMDVFTKLPSKCGGQALIAGPDGNWFVACSSLNIVLALNARSGQQLGVAARGGGLKAPTGIAFAPGNVLYVVSSGSKQILQFAQGGQFRGAVASNLPNGFGVAFHRNNVYSTGHPGIVAMHPPGATHLTHVTHKNLHQAKGLLFSGDQLFVAAGHMILRFGPRGGPPIDSTNIRVGRKEMKATYMTSSSINAGLKPVARSRQRHTEL